MQPLHTIQNNKTIKFHPIETELINDMIGREKTAIETYEILIDSAQTRMEQTEYENVLKKHILAKDFWKKEVISKDIQVNEQRSFRFSSYRFLINLTSKFSKKITLFFLKRFELMNLAQYKKIMTNKYISHQLKTRINRLFLYNQRRAVQKINVFRAA